MPLQNRNLFRLGQIVRTPETDHLMVEIIAVCGFTKCEAKMTLNAFQILAKVLHHTDEAERALRERVYKWELQFIGFRYTEIKDNPEDHVIIRFFNALVRFRWGDSSAFGDLIACLVVQKNRLTFDFAW